MDAAAVKVLLQEEDHVETLWAERVGPDLYRLDNSPFWAYGVSWQDIVEAHPDAAGQLRMARVVEKGGHRTVRVFLERSPEEAAETRAILDGVNARGATYEGMTHRYLAIDIPPGVDLMAIADYLTSQGVQWEHADPRYEELHPADS